MKLSAPHQKFAAGIASGLNGTAAYQAAYPKAKPDSARALAVGLLAKVSVREEITRLQVKVEDAFVLTRVEWLNRLLAVADKAEVKEDFSAAKGALREIGLANKAWYSPAETAGALQIKILKCWSDEPEASS